LGADCYRYDRQIAVTLKTSTDMHKISVQSVDKTSACAACMRGWWGGVGGVGWGE
jgi:hypothetical protein